MEMPVGFPLRIPDFPKDFPRISLEIPHGIYPRISLGQLLEIFNSSSSFIIDWIHPETPNVISVCVKPEIYLHVLFFKDFLLEFLLNFPLGCS